MSLRMEAGFQHLKDAFAEILAREVEFPLGTLVTVLNAKMTANTAHASVTLSVFPTNAQETVMDCLKDYEHEIKEGLSGHLRLRRIPAIHYHFDDTEAHAADIEAALHELKKQGEL